MNGEGRAARGWRVSITRRVSESGEVRRQVKPGGRAMGLGTVIGTSGFGAEDKRGAGLQG